MADHDPRPRPSLRHAVVVMGVSGCGKTTVAGLVAQALGAVALDGDHLHPAANVEKMRRGVALDDADRWPWLDTVAEALADAQRHPAGVVVACSALKRAYRDRLRRRNPGAAFLFLDGDPALIRARVEGRQHEYMPPGLLASQLVTLERPGPDEADVLRLDIAGTPAELVAQARAYLLNESLA